MSNQLYFHSEHYVSQAFIIFCIPNRTQNKTNNEIITSPQPVVCAYVSSIP